MKRASKHTVNAVKKVFEEKKLDISKSVIMEFSKLLSNRDIVGEKCLFDD